MGNRYQPELGAVSRAQHDPRKQVHVGYEMGSKRHPRFTGGGGGLAFQRRSGLCRRCCTFWANAFWQQNGRAPLLSAAACGSPALAPLRLLGQCRSFPLVLQRGCSTPPEIQGVSGRDLEPFLAGITQKHRDKLSQVTGRRIPAQGSCIHTSIGVISGRKVWYKSESSHQSDTQVTGAQTTKQLG